jgi:putative tryptophan/tyrosine transport system substrate-binding protein
MRRRDFLGVTTAVLAGWPGALQAQQRTPPVIGFLNSGSLAGYRNLLISFRKGLAEQGFVEGQNLVIEYGFAEGDFERLPQLAADLIKRGASIMVTGGIGSALGARKASATIPLVFMAGDDPVKFGLVASLNRPGGTATGIAWLTSEIFTKRLAILRELVPAAKTIGALINPRSPEVEPQVQEIEASAKSIGQSLEFVRASSDVDFDMAFASLAQRGAGALIVSNDAFFNSMRERIVGLAAKYRMPAIYDRREYTLAGGLISYGTSYAAAYRELGLYAAKVLKGTPPADMPIEQATKFEMVINLKTAASLGLDIPPQALALADEVIE